MFTETSYYFILIVSIVNVHLFLFLSFSLSCFILDI